MNELPVFLLELKLSIISVHKNLNFSRVISAALTFGFSPPSPFSLEVAGVMSELPPLPLRYQAFRQHTCGCSLEAREGRLVGAEIRGTSESWPALIMSDFLFNLKRNLRALLSCVHLQPLLP